MDLAKIRKKLKEAKLKQKESEKARASEERVEEEEARVLQAPDSPAEGPESTGTTAGAQTSESMHGLTPVEEAGEVNEMEEPEEETVEETVEADASEDEEPDAEPEAVIIEAAEPEVELEPSFAAVEMARSKTEDKGSGPSVQRTDVKAPMPAGEGPEVPAATGEVAEGAVGRSASETASEFLVFKLASELFAIKIDKVEEIVRLQMITRVPRVEKCLVGVTSLRGKIIPVIDLRERLKLSGEPVNEDLMKILILDGPKGIVGAIVDVVIDVIRFPEKAIFPPPGHLTEVELKFVEGVTVQDGMFLSIIRTDVALNFQVLAEGISG